MKQKTALKALFDGRDERLQALYGALSVHIHPAIDLDGLARDVTGCVAT